MVASRRSTRAGMGTAGTKGRARRNTGWFWLGAICVALAPTSFGSDDIAGLFAQRGAPQHHLHEHLIASPFGTIEPAIFSYGVQPVGTAIPRPPAIVPIKFDPRALAAIDWAMPADPRSHLVYPSVNRNRKGDRVLRAAPAPVSPARLSQPQRVDADRPPTMPAPADPPPATEMQAAAQFEAEVPPAGAIGVPHGDSSSEAPAFAGGGSGQAGADIYFALDLTGPASALERWAPGAEPVMVTAFDETGIKSAALDGGNEGPGGESVVGQGDVSRLGTPAQRLALSGSARAKAQRCLAEAVYFEARGEPLRGQEAVAQVVMNRVFSGYYPANVCSVVFQNARHFLGCQFTFACEHKNLHRIDEPAMWAQAKHIANDTLDGKIWLADIGHATHYHAYWVHPSWVHEMTRLYKLGVHTFYRPRAWGSGDYEPVWGTPPNT